MQKALITGITGQDGHYLKELLISKGYQVHGVIRKNSERSQRIERLFQEANGNEQLKLHYGDLLNLEDWVNLLETINPDEIYNLAAQSHVGDSFRFPEQTCNITGMGTLRILEAIKQVGLIDKVRFFQASSAEVFGNARECPQSETTPFYPRSPYGCAKVMAHNLTVNYREHYNMYACAGILFNHESPLRDETFVTRKISKVAARIKLKLQSTLNLGNLNARRDWGFAGDYVKAMWLMLQQKEPIDFVIATGETHSVQDFVEMAFGLLDLNWREYVEYDVGEERGNEKSLLQGNPNKIKEKLGWSASMSFKDLVKLMVEGDYELAQRELKENFKL
ncbi:MAG: GDP-mannose 4,6-dehydratase [Verrucomicrobia bacterium]|nr:MAG: GDP-mannose 4,6-dehydratase [Verrucomicrobiota bacterium]